MSNPVFLKSVVSFEKIKLNNNGINQIVQDIQLLLARMIYGANATVSADKRSKSFSHYKDGIHDLNELS